MPRKMKEPVKKTLALTSEEYWQWRTTISEMNEAKEKMKCTGLESQVLQSSAELTQCKLQLHRATSVRNARDNYEAAKSEYHKYKSTLEERLGSTLSGKMIDEFSFEVKDLPNETNNLKES